MGGHDGADYCDAVHGLLLGGALINDALQVGLVDAAYADSARVVAGLGDPSQDLSYSSGADNLLGVGLAGFCVSNQTASDGKMGYLSRWRGVDSANAEIIGAPCTGLEGLVDGADGDSDDGVWA